MPDDNPTSQHMNETNKHRDRPMIWLSNLTAQIESQLSVCQIESLNCRITLKKCPNRDFNPNRNWDLPITAFNILQLH